MADKPKRTRVQKTNEDLEQIALFEWVWLQRTSLIAPNGKIYREPLHQFVFASANGKYRLKPTAELLRRMGVHAGVFDISCTLARHGFTGLEMELKRPRTQLTVSGRLTVDQRIMRRAYRMAGRAAVVAYGASEAISWFEAYLDDRQGFRQRYQELLDRER